MDSSLRHSVGWIGLIVLGSAEIWLFLNATALRDESSQSPKPYSLSRVQLAWWTLVVLGSYIGVYASTGEFWPLNGTCLALLGISGGTSVAGRIIDTRQQEALLPRHQDAESSRGLFSDILSDENGISVHRFQTVAFNLAFGLSFIVSTFQATGAGAFPTFDSTTLLLLGVSSSVYIAVKPNETSAVPAVPHQQAVSASSSAEGASVQAPAESGPVATRAS